MSAPARVAAFHALRAVETGRLDLPAALAASRTHLADPRDRALAADIVQGTLRWQRTLDALVAATTRTGRAPADADVLCVLRLSVYQLLHLDRVPASAVVDDAVDLTRHARRGQSTGFVNACLRSLLRRRHRPDLPSRPLATHSREAAVAYLGITHSHPDWLVERWLDRYGFDAAETWVQFNNRTPAPTLRTNSGRYSRAEVQAWLAARGVVTRDTRVAPHGLVVESSDDSRVLHEPSDRFVVQDEASQLVAMLVGASPGDRVLDLCAAPGGKTTAMAAEMDERGLIVACDVRARRVRLLQASLNAAATRTARAVHVERAGPLPFGVAFDRVLVDAPCSGLGTLRRDPDVKWRRTEAALADFALVQRDILERAAPCVRPGGRLVYATCSSEPEENDAVVRGFLAAHPEFQLDRRRDQCPPAVTPLLDDDGILRTLPHRDELDAFYAAPLVRLETPREAEPR
jgi:16S rRNA (cytosine967-C5)-methyltransferase